MPNFDLAKQWIHNCVKNHDHIYANLRDISSDGNPPELPTRVLDVGFDLFVREPRLTITEGIRGDYVTLSHCWGKTQSFTTLKANLQQHLDSIPFSQLPRTLQDAVTVTRALGYRYL